MTWAESKKMKTSLKDWRRVYRKLKPMRGMDETERILLARSLAATPDERWEMHENFLRSHGLFSHWERRAYGFKW
jgi:hypothetical protein